MDDPALELSISEANLEIEHIVLNEQEPDFTNTIEALDKVGLAEDRIMFILNNMLNVNTSDTLQQLSRKLIPMDTDFYNGIYLNEKLFERVNSSTNRRIN